MDVEKCLYNTKCEMQEQKNSQKADEKDEEKVVQIVEDCAAAVINNDAVEKSKKFIVNRIIYKYVILNTFGIFFLQQRGIQLIM